MKTNRGFTLIETLLVIVVFTLLAGAISSLVVMGYRTYSYAWEQSQAIEEARRGIETMVREIREAKSGDNGSYAIEKAEDKEFIFYSDIDKDGATERIRYFLGSVGSGSQTQECVAFIDGGFCESIFSDFFSGDLVSAEVKVSVEGDFGWSQEHAEVFADGIKLGDICRSDCSDCAGNWQGTQIFDVTEQAADNSIQFTIDANHRVNDFCDWIDQNHAMKAKFEFSWTEDVPATDHEFKKGITNPTEGLPIEYPTDEETIQVLSSYVRNVPPIFKYFDKDGQEITDRPARLIDTKVMRVYLIININPSRGPNDFELKSSVQLRNLKEK